MKKKPVISPIFGFSDGRNIEWSKSTFPDNERNRQDSRNSSEWNAREGACLFGMIANGRLMWSRCAMQIAG